MNGKKHLKSNYRSQNIILMVFGCLKPLRQVCHVTRALPCLFRTPSFFNRRLFFHPRGLFFHSQARPPRLCCSDGLKPEKGPWVSIICIAVEQMHRQLKSESQREQGERMNEEDRAFSFHPSLLSPPVSQRLAEQASGRGRGRGVRGGGGVFSFLFGEGKGDRYLS